MSTPYCDPDDMVRLILNRIDDRMYMMQQIILERRRQRMLVMQS